MNTEGHEVEQLYFKIKILLEVEDPPQILVVRKYCGGNIISI